MAGSKSPASRRYVRFVKWSRRLSSALTCVLVAIWIRQGPSPLEQIELWLAPVLDYLRILPSDRATIAIVTVWFAFLSQFNILWAICLPIYLLVFAPGWLLWKSGGFVVGSALDAILSPVLKAVESLDERGNLIVTPTATGAPKKHWPIKRLWLLLVFLYIVALRDVALPWTACLPPVLAFPIWMSCLKLAYRLAVAPKSLAGILAALGSASLDSRLKTLNDASAKKVKTVSGAYIYKGVNVILRRYSQDQIHAAVQREAIFAFAAVLATALFASSLFWGLFASALLQFNSHALDAYSFFSTGSVLEAMLWAWGCMTTTIDFPGSLAPTPLKVLHAAILVSGLFQLTFLLACFSIMTGTETDRTANKALQELAVIEGKLRQTQELEILVIDVPPTDDKPTESV